MDTISDLLCDSGAAKRRSVSLSSVSSRSSHERTSREVTASAIKDNNWGQRMEEQLILTFGEGIREL